jgi:hydrogenase nickel insertion protein HypA
VHEWALAEAVVAAAAEVARDGGMASVREVVVGIGELQAVERDAFELGLSAARQGVPELEGATFLLETDPARCTCRACGKSWTLRESLGSLPEDERESVHLVPELVTLFIACPACASPDLEIAGGRGVSLVSVSS